MRYIQRLNKDVNKSNEIYRLNKDVNKDEIYTKAKMSNEIYTKAKQRCKQKQ